jgi:hypothetical protein
MFPLTNRYPRRFHPYTRFLALHTEFPAERPSFLLHSLYTIFPTDSDANAAESPQPLLSRSAAVSAPDYFASLEANRPNIVHKKPPGEAGGTARGGYQLQAALSWPVEIYRKVQVSIFYSSQNIF